MAIRENVVGSAVAFLQDPNVAGSPIENRIAFLHSKNLTNEEVDAALAGASRESSNPTYSNNNVHQLMVRQPQHRIGTYQEHPWQTAPPERDWRDWFIMATVLSSVGFGMYNIVKRYVYPMIAPPTSPQLEQDKKAIDEKFDKAFTLLEQLSKDTEELKTSEQSRTARLDVALSEVETILSNIKTSSCRREEESRRITEEVHGLRHLIPKAIGEQKEFADAQLKDIGTELKSLKVLLGQRMNLSTPVTSSTYGRTVVPGAPFQTSQPRNTTTDILPIETETKSPVASSDGPATENNTLIQDQGPSPYVKSKAAIPSWQLAANRGSSSSKPNEATSSEQSPATT